MKLLVNSGFESSSIAPWYGFNVVIVNEPVKTCSSSLLLATGASSSYIAQEFPETTGEVAGPPTGTFSSTNTTGPQGVSGPVGRGGSGGDGF